MFTLPTLMPQRSSTWQAELNPSFWALVINLRLEIETALKRMVHAQRAREFQWLAVQIAKTKWPELEATLEQADGGEDATAFFSGADGRKRRLASSITGTLKKIREDAARIRERKVRLDELVFITPVPITNLQVSKWCQEIKSEFGHDLHIISQSELVTLLERPENAWLCQLYLDLDFSNEPNLANLEAIARHAAGNILAGWKTEFECDPSLAVALTLIQESTGSAKGGRQDDRVHLGLGDVAKFARERGRVIFAGPPGSGKTFTLIQLADFSLKDASAPIPFLISLPGWASQPHGFQAYIEQHLSSHGLKAADFLRLRAAGRVALLLNGWNEMAESFGATTASGQLQDFALNNVATPLIISTRTTNLTPPLANAVTIRVQPLSLQQKLSIIQRSGLQDPSKLLHSLERNATLAGVTETPLFLTAVIELARNGGEELPATRYGILRNLVEQTEQKASAALSVKPCEGFHHRYLERIALEMTKTGSVTLSPDTLQNAVADTAKALQRDGHLAAAASSTAVVESLVKHHLLVLSPSLGGVYRFVHQQFQEWFAAESLHRLATSLAKDEGPGMIFEFQKDVLNHPRWFQPLAFLLERLGNGDETERRVAAKLIEWAQSVDLMLASELAGIAGEKVWPLVREALGQMLRKWYARGSARHRRCALAAMLATGAPDFGDILWPLLESDEQTMRFTCRAWGPFLLTSLGPEFSNRFKGWSPERRKNFIQEMSLNLSQEHIAFATEVLTSETSVAVKYACLELLASGGAYKTVVQNLEGLDSDGQLSADLVGLLRRLPRSYLNHFTSRLQTALAAIQHPTLRHAIIDLLRSIDAPDRLALVKAEVNRLTAMPGVVLRAEYWWHTRDSEKGQPNVGPYVAGYLDELFETDPNWAAGWLVEQLVQGRLWEEPFTKHLASAADAVFERLMPAVLGMSLDANVVRTRAELVARADSRIVTKSLLNEHLARKKQKAAGSMTPSFDRGDAVRNAIYKIPFSSLVDAILDETEKLSDFHSCWELLHTIPPGYPISPKWRLQLSDYQRDRLRALVLRLHEMRPTDWEGTDDFQASIAALLGAVGKAEDVRVLERWIEEERQRRAEQDAEWHAKMQVWQKAGRTRRFPPPRMMRISWNTWCEALVQAGGQESAEVLIRLLRIPEFLGDAAWRLVRLARPEFNELYRGFGERPNYSEIYRRRAELAISKKVQAPIVARHADAIHAVIQDYLPEIGRADSKFPKRELSEAANALAHLDHSRALPILLRVSADKYSLWIVAKALHELTLQGVALPGSQVAEALEPFIEEHEKQPFGGTDNWYAVIQCLAILLLSDNPTIGIERTRRIPTYRLQNYHVREILELLASCHAPEAGVRLIELANVPEIRGRYFHELVDAMSRNANPECRQALLNILDQLAAGKLASTSDMIEPLAKAVAHVAKTDEKVWDEIGFRCKRVGSAVERSTLAIVLHEVGTERAATALCNLIHDEFTISYHMEQLVEAIAESKVPAGSSNAYSLEPRAAASLRKQLYDLAVKDSTRRTSALELLGVIAECRIEHGQPPDEPLHPNIEALESAPTPWQIMK